MHYPDSYVEPDWDDMQWEDDMHISGQQQRRMLYIDIDFVNQKCHVYEAER